MKNKVLTGTQILLVLVWAVVSYMLDKGINLAVFNILPIPNFALMIVTITLLGIGYWLQGLKDKRKL